MAAPLFAPPITDGNSAVNTPQIGSGDVSGSFVNILFFPASISSTSGLAAQQIGTFTSTIITGLTLQSLVVSPAGVIQSSVVTSITNRGAVVSQLGTLIQSISTWQSIKGAVAKGIANFTQSISVTLITVTPHTLAPIIRRLVLLIENRGYYSFFSSRLWSEGTSDRIESPKDSREFAPVEDDRNLNN